MWAMGNDLENRYKKQAFEEHVNTEDCQAHVEGKQVSGKDDSRYASRATSSSLEKQTETHPLTA